MVDISFGSTTNILRARRDGEREGVRKRNTASHFTGTKPAGISITNPFDEKFYDCHKHRRDERLQWG